VSPSSVVLRASKDMKELSAPTCALTSSK
jgi:hypothetical protein